MTRRLKRTRNTFKRQKLTVSWLRGLPWAPYKLKSPLGIPFFICILHRWSLGHISRIFMRFLTINFLGSFTNISPFVVLCHNDGLLQRNYHIQNMYFFLCVWLHKESNIHSYTPNIPQTLSILFIIYYLRVLFRLSHTYYKDFLMDQCNYTSLQGLHMSCF